MERQIHVEYTHVRQIEILLHHRISKCTVRKRIDIILHLKKMVPAKFVGILLKLERMYLIVFVTIDVWSHSKQWSNRENDLNLIYMVHQQSILFFMENCGIERKKASNPI